MMRSRSWLFQESIQSVANLTACCSLIVFPRSAEVARRPAEAPATARVQGYVHFFQRTEETREGVFEMNGTAAGGAEILRPELIAARHHCNAKGPVFMGALRPREVSMLVDPERETHRFS